MFKEISQERIESIEKLTRYDEPLKLVDKCLVPVIIVSVYITPIYIQVITKFTHF